MPALLSHIEQQQNQLIAFLTALVECESPSDDAASVNRFVDRFADSLSGWADLRTVRFRKYGRGLRCEFRLPGPRRQLPGKILAVGHSDTVWPLGTLRTMPCRIAEGRVWGPGVFDMKAGLAYFVFAMRALRDLDIPIARKVVLWIVPDEEVGSAESRPKTEAEAQGSSAVLVLEPSAGLDGKLKTARKGVGGYRVAVHGIAAHAGLDFTRGANAIVELARQTERIAGFTRLERGLTVSPGIVHGGTRTNVVPEHAELDIDFRIERLRDFAALERQMKSLKPFDRRCRLEVTGGLNRPPLERVPAGVRLFRMAQRIAAGFGVALEETSVGGGSDGNLTAALGIPTLDGLGGIGEGAHALNESVLINRMPDRVALLAQLVERLSTPAPNHPDRVRGSV